METNTNNESFEGNPLTMGEAVTAQVTPENISAPFQNTSTPASPSVEQTTTSPIMSTSVSNPLPKETLSTSTQNTVVSEQPVITSTSITGSIIDQTQVAQPVGIQSATRKISIAIGIIILISVIVGASLYYYFYIYAVSLPVTQKIDEKSLIIKKETATTTPLVVTPLSVDDSIAIDESLTNNLNDPALDDNSLTDFTAQTK